MNTLFSTICNLRTENSNIEVWWCVPGAYLGLAPDQAGHDAVCSSEREGVIPLQLFLILWKTIISLASLVIKLMEIRFSLEEINLVKLPLLSLMIICLKKKSVDVVSVMQGVICSLLGACLSTSPWHPCCFCG